MAKVKYYAKEFQSTPPQGGDYVVSLSSQAFEVSIHAPAGGATYNISLWCVLHEFQSTPPQGGRQATAAIRPTGFKFQSTPPQGGGDSVCK